jgi:hypothetical protein
MIHLIHLFVSSLIDEDKMQTLMRVGRVAQYDWAYFS